MKLEKNEFKEMLEQGRPQPRPEDATSGLEAPLTTLEGAVAELRHFISSEDWPDLTVVAHSESAVAASSNISSGGE